MSKSNFFPGQPIFNQLLSLIPDSTITRLSKRYNTDRYCKKFRSRDHLITMLYASFHRCGSIREVVTGMQAMSQRISHLGLRHNPCRSTLSDANKRTSHNFFEDLYHQLYRFHYGPLPDSLKGKKDADRLFIIDSTAITLFSDVMHGAGSFGLNGRKKGGAKAHTLIKASHDVPTYVYLSEAKVSDKQFLKQIDFLPKGSIVVLDKGYNSYQKLIEWSQNEITWVMRLNEGAVWRIKAKNKVTKKQRNKGVRKDYIIELGNPQTAHLNALQTVRLVIYHHKETNREFSFISNDLKCNPGRIAKLYKNRWQIELVFKRLKSNFPLKYFLGDNPNAIKIQIWCALIADLLVKIIKDKTENFYKRKWSFANIAALIRLHLSTYINLYTFLANPEKALIQYKPPEFKSQLSLF